MDYGIVHHRLFPGQQHLYTLMQRPDGTLVYERWEVPAAKPTQAEMQAAWDAWLAEAPDRARAACDADVDRDFLRAIVLEVTKALLDLIDQLRTDPLTVLPLVDRVAFRDTLLQNIRLRLRAMRGVS